MNTTANKTLKFTDCPKNQQRQILRKYLNKELRLLRKDLFIDGDFKWLLLNSKEKAFPIDPTDIINLNKGAIIAVANVAGVSSWQRVYGYAHSLSVTFGCDTLTIIRLLIQLVRATPRGISRSNTFDKWSTMSTSDTDIERLIKLEFTTDEISINRISINTGALTDYLHIYNLNIQRALTNGIYSRILALCVRTGRCGVTVTPQRAQDKANYKSLGFTPYTVDGLMRYTIPS